MSRFATPSPEDVHAFLGQLRAGRERLRSLADDVSGPEQEQLAQALDVIAEQLLVADEELRVQSEHLEQSTRRLDLLVAVHEELFADAPTPYVQTDADGVIVRYNHAARRLLNLPPVSARSRTLAGLVLPTDRHSVRDLLSRIRGAGNAAAPTADRVEVTVRTADAWVPVVLRGRRLSDAGTGRPLLHWELQPSAPAEAVAPAVAVDRGVPDPQLNQVQNLADAAADFAKQATPELALATGGRTGAAGDPGQ